MKKIRATIVVLALLGLFGCRAGGVSEEQVDIRGTIIALSPAEAGGEVLGSFLVEGRIEQDTEYDRAVVRVTADTEVLIQRGGGRRLGSFADLAVGQRVEVAFTGPVAESYPVQATAGRVVVLEPAALPAPGESPLPQPGASPLMPRPPSMEGPVQKAIEFLAAQLGIPPEMVRVISSEAVDWPDTSLGCPEPGIMYAQVITPGYRLILEAEGAWYEVHTDRTGERAVICRTAP